MEERREGNWRAERESKFLIDKGELAVYPKRTREAPHAVCWHEPHNMVLIELEQVSSIPDYGDYHSPIKQQTSGASIGGTIQESGKEENEAILGEVGAV